jgi:hypothetical protein
VVQHHDGYDRIEFTNRLDMLNRFPDKARASRGSWIRANRIEAKFSHAANKTAITTPSIKDPCARRKRRGDDRVKVLPPLGTGHAPNRT